MADQDVEAAMAMMFKIGSLSTDLLKAILKAGIAGGQMLKSGKQSLSNKTNSMVNSAKNAGAKVASKFAGIGTSGVVSMKTLQNKQGDTTAVDINAADLANLKKELKKYSVDFACVKNGDNMYTVAFKAKDAEFVQRACEAVARDMKLLSDKEIEDCKTDPEKQIDKLQQAWKEHAEKVNEKIEQEQPKESVSQDSQEQSQGNTQNLWQEHAKELERQQKQELETTPKVAPDENQCVCLEGKDAPFVNEKAREEFEQSVERERENKSEIKQTDVPVLPLQQDEQKNVTLEQDVRHAECLEGKKAPFKSPEAKAEYEKSIGTAAKEPNKKYNLRDENGRPMKPSTLRAFAQKKLAERRLERLHDKKQNVTHNKPKTHMR